MKLQRAGREWKACCPFHKEKTPSFTLSDEKGFYHCFGCGAHGDAIRWLTDARGLPFIDAVKELADSAGLEVPAGDPAAQQRAQRAASLYEVMDAAQAWFQEQLAGLQGTAARTYLEERGFTRATIEKFGFGFAPDSRGKLKQALQSFGDDKLVEAGLLIAPEENAREPFDRFRGRLMIPIRDQRGRVIAFGGRILGDGVPKYLNSPETPLFDKGATLFNLDRAGPKSRDSGRLIVVEGYFDVIALDQVGISEAVAPLGTALTEAQLERLWRLSDIPFLCFDGDSAGKKAGMRAALRSLPILAPEKSLNFVMLPGGLDPDDLVREGGKDAFEEVLEKRLTLDQLIWEWEYTAADFETPEGRASFGRRLREYARGIRDMDISTQYLALYKQKIYDLFAVQPQSRVTEGGKWLKKRAHRPEQLHAISKFGTSKTLFAPAALEGLRRYPELISSHADIVGQLSVLLLHRDLRLLCHEMLDAALGNPGLDVEQLDEALKRAVPEILHRLAKRRRVRFSFLSDRASPEKARADLAAVLELLAATPEIESALKAATARLSSDWEDDIFAEQIRMRGLRERLDLDWADLLNRQADTLSDHNSVGFHG